MKMLKISSKKDRAQAMVEFAIVLPILLLVVYGLIETGRLIFTIAFVNNATRQAVRYGSTSGEGPNGLPRYLDCAGIRAEAERMDFLNSFDASLVSNFSITYDSGPGTAVKGNCNGSAYVGTEPGQNDRILVTVNSNFTGIVPKIVPFLSRTVAGGNPISSESSRTLVLSIKIVPPRKPTTTVINSDSPDYSLIGQTVTIEVTVTATGSTPTGTVTVTTDDGKSCTIDPLSGGTGNCDIVFDTTGEKVITATYNGDVNHEGSDDTENHTVKAPTNIVIVDSPDPTLPNGTVNVNFTVNSTWPGTPTGTVTITGQTSGCSTPVTLVNRTGSCSVVFDSDGTKVLTATYSGDATYDTSNKTEIHTVLLPGVTTTTITAHTPNPSQVNQTVNVTVVVTSTNTPTGTVSISGATSFNCPPLSGGTTTCTVVFNSVGTKSLNATYTPDTPAFTGSSTTSPTSHTVGLPGSTTTITADTPDPSGPGDSVTVSFTVTGGSTTPTGTVTITGQSSGCTTPVTLVNGAGSCSVVFSSVGAKTITATYSGNGSYAGSSDTETHSVFLVAPAIPNCDTLSVSNLSLLKMTNGNMTIDITNPFGSLLQISTIKVTWNHDKGHKTGGDKTLKLDKINLGSQVWDDIEFGPDATIIPTAPAYINANSSGTLEFVFHQIFDRWDDTESVELFFTNAGCESVSIKQTQHE